MSFKITLMLQILLASFAFAATNKLALNWKPEPQFGGFYAAEKFFKAAGLDVQIQEGGSGTPTVQMLANNQVDFAIVSAEEILISNERNSKNPVVGVFAVFQTNPQVIFCHAEKGFKSLKEVLQSTSTLAWQSGLSYALFLKKHFPEAHVKFVPYQGGITPFLAQPNYCQQGFATSEPLLAVKSGQKTSVYMVADEGFNPYTTVLAVRQKDLLEKPELVGKVVTAVRKGWQEYLKDPQPTNQRMAQLNKAMDQETFAQSALAQTKLIESKGSLGEMSLERWKTLGEQLVELGLLKSPPSLEKCFKNL